MACAAQPTTDISGVPHPIVAGDVQSVHLPLEAAGTKVEAKALVASQGWPAASLLLLVALALPLAVADPTLLKTRAAVHQFGEQTSTMVALPAQASMLVQLAFRLRVALGYAQRAQQLESWRPQARLAHGGMLLCH